jgi:hypothetical protein
MKGKKLNLQKSAGILCALACTVQLHAQGVAYEWARNMGGGGVEYGNAITTDATGNVYIAGYFTGTGDFNPGTGTLNMTSAGAEDIFVTKLDASGQLVWAKQLGGTESDQCFGIAVDAQGNVYTTGYFRGTADFDPGAGNFNLSAFSAMGPDIFVSKLDSSGNFKWAKQMGGNTWDQATGIQVDAWGNVYTTGYFQTTADFDPGTTTANLTTTGGFDIFVSKLDSAGNYLWARNMGGPIADFSNALAVDEDGSVYTTGIFQGTGDFNPGAGTANITAMGSYEVFVSKLDSAGNYVWAKGMGGSGIDWGYGIAVDQMHNVYTVGTFDGTADFDPGTGTSNLTSFGSSDVFVSKLDASGNFAWVRQLGGTANDLATAVTLDRAGNPVLCGYFNGSADFDPGTGTTSLTAAGADDIFACKISSAGALKWVKQSGGLSNDYSFSIKADPSGNIYTSGLFNGIADFDPGPGTASLNSDMGGHVFAQKLFCTDTTSSMVTATACGSYTYNGTTYTAGGNYLHRYPNALGCDSTVTLQLTINTITPATITRTGNVLSTAATYASYQWFRNNSSIAGATANTYTVTQNGNYTVAVSASNGCKDTSGVTAVDDITGISGQELLAAQISIYPNPAADRIHIQAPRGLQVTLMSMEGRVLLQEKETTTLAIGSLANGTYWLKFSNKEGRFIKLIPVVKNQ